MSSSEPASSAIAPIADNPKAWRGDDHPDPQPAGEFNPHPPGTKAFFEWLDAARSKTQED